MCVQRYLLAVSSYICLISSQKVIAGDVLSLFPIITLVLYGNKSHVFCSVNGNYDVTVRKHTSAYTVYYPRLRTYLHSTNRAFSLSVAGK